MSKKKETLSKNPIEEIGEDIKKVKDKIERNWKKIIIITTISVLIVSLALFFAGIRIRFAISDTLVLQLKPSDHSFKIKNNENHSITFNTHLINSMFCTAKCSYTFYDRSEEKVIDRGSFYIKNDGDDNRTYTLIPYRSGSGQKIYNFDVQCSNIKSFLCATKAPLKRRASFITLSYDLTEQEKEIKVDLKKTISESFILINNASATLQKSSVILNSAEELIEYLTLNQEYILLSERLKLSLRDSDNIFNLWSKERYIELNSLYGTSINKSTELYFDSIQLLDNITDSIKKQNNLMGDYNHMKESFFGLSNEQYPYINASEQDIKTRFNQIQDHLSQIRSGRFVSLFDLQHDIIETSNLIMEYNQILESNFNHFNNIGKDLAMSEYKQKCDLSYCENLTGDVCFDIAKISSEYQNMSYVVGEDIIKLDISNTTKDYYDSFCLDLNITYFPDNISDFNIIEPIENISTWYPIENELTENPPICCVYGYCSPCCTQEECKEDPSLYPMVLIHGHSMISTSTAEPSLDSFSKIQFQLQEDGFINAGIIRFDSSDYKKNDWGLAVFPIVLKASYYYDYFYSVGNYVYITRNTDNLDTYAIRMNDIIELVKLRTEKPKVNIMAHSMGGLVARRYIQIFGDDSVNKIILIGTPNKGITGSVKRFCNLFGEERECEDMYSDSIFMKKLNDPNYKPENLKIYTISGKGCETEGQDGDGIVTYENSLIDYAESYVIDGKCDDTFKRDLHSFLLDIDKYPKVYDIITEILKEKVRKI